MTSEPKSRTLLDYAHICHRGLVRGENQDAMAVVETPAGTLFVISDGVGGYAGGAEAAQMINAEAAVHAQIVPEEGDALPALVELVQRLNGSVYARGQKGPPELSRMSATVVMILVRGVGCSEADILNVGDSRAYLYRAHRLQQLSIDHTAAQLLVDARTISTEESRTHPQSSVLTRSMGQRPEVVPSTMRILLEAKDLLLLCSDGLHGYVEDSAIGHVLSDEGLTVPRKTDALLQLALDAGGGDNITIQLVEVASVAQLQTTAAALISGKSRTVHLSGFRRFAAAVAAVGLLAAGCVLGYHWWQSQVPASIAPTRSVPPSVLAVPAATPAARSVTPARSPVMRENAERLKDSRLTAPKPQPSTPIDSSPANAPANSPAVRSTLPGAVHRGLDKIVTEGHHAGDKVRERLPDGAKPHPKNGYRSRETGKGAP